MNSNGRRSKTTQEFSKLVSFGEHNNLFIDKLCAFCLAISPILQHYMGPFEDAGHSILILFFPYVLLRLLYKMRSFRIADLGVVAMLIIFYLYRVVDHGPTFFKLAQRMLIIIYFMAIALGCINVKRVLKTAYYVSIAASVCIIIQYFCFYAFGFHLQLVPASLLLPRAGQWILGAQTGLAGITGRLGTFYRPSAFFLEPSHIFLYIFPHLFIMLLSQNMNRWRIRRAMLITLALVLSTSGMGISVAAGAWALYFGLSSGKQNIIKIWNIFKPKNVMALMVLLLLLVSMYFTIPTIGKSVDRILGNTGRVDAISGRTTQSIAIIKSLAGSKLLFGVVESTSDFEAHMPGFMGTLYRYGLIGIILSYAFYVRCFFKLKAEYFWISFVIISVSFFSAHTHGTFYMLYYVIILLEGNNQLKLRKAQSKSSSVVTTRL